MNRCQLFCRLCASILLLFLKSFLEQSTQISWITWRCSSSQSPSGLIYLGATRAQHVYDMRRSSPRNLRLFILSLSLSIPQLNGEIIEDMHSTFFFLYPRIKLHWSPSQTSYRTRHRTLSVLSICVNNEASEYQRFPVFTRFTRIFNYHILFFAINFWWLEAEFPLLVLEYACKHIRLRNHAFIRSKSIIAEYRLN